jgi:hypothetical protein
MGVGLYPRYDRDIADANYDGDGKGLVLESENLDRIARELGVAEFSSFIACDPSMISELMGEEDIPESPVDELSAPWFSVVEGLKVVRALIGGIQGNEEYSKLLREPDYTIEELTELERCLVSAESAQVKFRLDMW